MGNEAACKVTFGKQESNGKALLETSEILFRGDFRLKIAFANIKSAKVVNGNLHLQTPEGPVVFHSHLSPRSSGRSPPGAREYFAATAR